MRGVRGQASVEYLLVLGMAFLLLLPGGYLFYSFSQGSQDEISDSRINTAGEEIINKVEEMYSVGQNSWSTLQINMPESVENIYVENNNELVIVYNSQVGESEAVFFSRVNITTPYGGNLSSDFRPGVTKIRVTSQGDEVMLKEVRQ